MLPLGVYFRKRRAWLQSGSGIQGHGALSRRRGWKFVGFLGLRAGSASISHMRASAVSARFSVVSARLSGCSLASRSCSMVGCARRFRGSASGAGRSLTRPQAQHGVDRLFRILPCAGSVVHRGTGPPYPRKSIAFAPIQARSLHFCDICTDFGLYRVPAIDVCAGFVLERICTVL